MVLAAPARNRFTAWKSSRESRTTSVAPAMAIIHSIYRYPVKGLSPEALPRIALAPRRNRAWRPALCHRERTVRVRSFSARLFVEAAFPDADEERAARRAADGVWPGGPRVAPLGRGGGD